MKEYMIVEMMDFAGMTIGSLEPLIKQLIYKVILQLILMETPYGFTDLILVKEMENLPMIIKKMMEFLMLEIISLDIRVIVSAMME